MNITEVTVKKFEEGGSTVAYASITIDGEFSVRNIRIMKKKDGGDLFLAFPSKQKKDGEYYDIACPITKEAREEITELVLSEYYKED